MPNSHDELFLAHQGQLLSDHLKGVAKHARRFANKVGLGNQGELIGLIHDLGKYSYNFQSYIKSALGACRRNHIFSQAPILS